MPSIDFDEDHNVPQIGLYPRQPFRAPTSSRLALFLVKIKLAPDERRAGYIIAAFALVSFVIGCWIFYANFFKGSGYTPKNEEDLQKVGRPIITVIP